MEIHQLRAFLALAEELHFTRAAARLNETQPALSQQIRRLEREIGGPLFLRSTRHVRLTPAGDVLVPMALELTAQADASLAAARAAADPSGGELRVGIFHGGAAELTVPILRTFAAAHPRVRLRLVELPPSRQEADLLGGAVDVVLARPPLDPEHVEDTVLLLEPRVLLVADTHPLADAGSVTVETLLSCPTLRVESSLPRLWQDFWTFADRRNGEPIRTAGEPVTTVTEALLVTATGLTIMPTALTAARLAPLTGVRWLPITDAAPCTMSVATRRGDRRELVRGFCSTATAVAARLAALVPQARAPGDGGVPTVSPAGPGERGRAAGYATVVAAEPGLGGFTPVG